MFNNWRLMITTMNMSDGEADEVIRVADEKTARQKFYDKLSQLGGNPQTKKVMVKLFDPNGNLADSRVIDNSQYIEPTEE